MQEKLLREIDRRAKLLGFTDITLAKAAGLGRDAVRDIRRRPNMNPSHKTVSAIAKTLGCTVADLTGEDVSPTLQRNARETSDTVSINELDVHVVAGAGVNDGGDVMSANEANAVVGVHTYPVASFREAYGINPKRVRIIPVRGTSMEPELWSGQRVMVDIEDRIPSPPGIFVVWDGLGLVLKYVEVIANSNPVRVRISSAHKAFQPYERNLDEAYINGRVIGVWKRM